MTNDPNPQADAGAKLAEALRSRWMPEAMPAWAEVLLSEYDAATKPKTVVVNGVEVPEPVREAPDDGAFVYYVDIAGREMAFMGSFHSDSGYDKRALSRGLIHRTKDAAESHARALIAATAQEKQA